METEKLEESDKPKRNQTDKLTNDPTETPRVHIENVTAREPTSTTSPVEDVTTMTPADDGKVAETDNAVEPSPAKDQWFAVLGGFAIVCSLMSVMSILTVLTCWRASRGSHVLRVEEHFEEQQFPRPREPTPSPPAWPSPPMTHRRLEPVEEEPVYIDLQAMEQLLQRCRVARH